MLSITLFALLQITATAGQAQPATTQPAAAPAAAAPAGAPTTQPAGTQPATTQPNRFVGPLRLDISAIAETRRFIADPGPTPPQSELTLQFRLVGEKLEQAVRVGRALMTEAVDDTGKNLLKPDTYTEQDRTDTLRVREPADRLRERGLTQNVKLDAPPRTAKSIKKIKGAMRVICASTSEDVPVPQVMQFKGKAVENERLKQLGVSIQLISADKLTGVQPAAGQVILQVDSGNDRVRDVQFYDAWSQKIRYQGRNVQTTDGKPATVYQLADAAAADQCQMVVQVWPQVEEISVQFEMNDIPLP